MDNSLRLGGVEGMIECGSLQNYRSTGLEPGMMSKPP